MRPGVFRVGTAPYLYDRPMLLGRVSSTTWLLAGLVVAIAIACSTDKPAGDHASPTPSASERRSGHGVNIDSSWQQARFVEGHQVHVLREQIACRQCHVLTDEAIGPAKLDGCGACHEKEAQIAHAENQATKTFGPTVKADCGACHAFVPLADGSEPVASDCSRCHGAAGETPPGQPRGVATHAEADCSACHRPHHDVRPVTADCRSCHGDVRSIHAAVGKTATETCTTCHSTQHGHTDEARAACVDCHAQHPPLVPPAALFPKGHDTCLSCHQAHGQAAAASCRSCHSKTLVLAEERVPTHKDCNQCHEPHNVRVSVTDACIGCHQTLSDAHPKHGGGVGCIGCHDPHPKQASAPIAAPCSSCHSPAHADPKAHGGTACTQCHKPHAFVSKLADRQACAACHAQALRATEHRTGHQSCEGCHAGLPHHPATGATPCASCHEKESKTSHPGHKACVSCHEPHGGEVIASCASCHRAEATTKHGAIKTGCTTCHQPHGPQGVATAPACTTCHTPAALPGLHKGSDHSACASCHTGHGDPKPSAARVGCLSCHTDRNAHFPTAGACSSCHLFGKTR